MSHRHHLVCAVAAVGLAVLFLAAADGGAALAGVGLALLICPLVMGTVMWLLMRQPRSTPHHEDADRHDQRVTVSR